VPPLDFLEPGLVQFQGIQLLVLEAVLALLLLLQPEAAPAGELARTRLSSWFVSCKETTWIDKCVHGN
jgi:hypothetical protein